MAAVDIKPAIYVSDKGIEFQVGVNGAYLAQESAAGISKLGGDSTPTITGAMHPLPSSVKPRRAYMKDSATGYARTIIVLTPDSVLATDPDAQLTFEDSNNVTHTLGVVKVLGEDFGRTFSAA
jgi:hypothetical protein